MPVAWIHATGRSQIQRGCSPLVHSPSTEIGTSHRFHISGEWGRCTSLDNYKDRHLQSSIRCNIESSGHRPRISWLSSTWDGLERYKPPLTHNQQTRRRKWCEGERKAGGWEKKIKTQKDQTDEIQGWTVQGYRSGFSKIVVRKKSWPDAWSRGSTTTYIKAHFLSNKHRSVNIWHHWCWQGQNSDEDDTTSTLLTWAEVTIENEVQQRSRHFNPRFTRIKSSSLDLEETGPTFTTEYRNAYWISKILVRLVDEW